MKMFHVERNIKTLLLKGFFVLSVSLLFSGCITPRHTVEIDDYILLQEGKEILGRDTGLTCFMFEKYRLGATEEISYNIVLDEKRFKVFLYTNDELMKYFDLSQFMVSNVETEVNRVGSSANFIGLSVIDESNNDCLAASSLYQNLVIKYLKELKYEFNSN
jgi:hypothetical protein